MSHLYFSTDTDALAGRLLEEIAVRQKVADPFEPISIVVPNRFMQQWLKFRIAREWGVAINLRFSFLEHALWEWLGELDPRDHRKPELLDDERYQLLVLSILWNDVDPALAPLQAFFADKDADAVSRLGSRRAWQLAGRLGTLIRDYEYHRQKEIIQQWLMPNGRVDVPPAWREREAGQRAVFRAVTDDETGRRSILNRTLGRNFKTLPQYVMEFTYDVKDPRTPPRRLVHLFGLSQVSPLHLQALEVLWPYHDWRLYHLNPLVSRLTPGVGMKQVADAFRGEQRPDARPGTELLHLWGRAGAESLHLAAGFRRQLEVNAKVVHDTQKRPATVLGRLQNVILGSDDDSPPQPQDTSLQIVGCPGIWREAETIHAGIVNALQQNPQLRQTDVAVLATDMDLYRPVLTAVFDRPPRRLSFALADYSAARVSALGQALVGMLDLALENLSRTRVFDVLLNPCVLARLEVDRDAARHWLTWAERLGIYHGWDDAEKKAQGYAASSLYSWKLGLRKLRLGQFMTVTADDASAPAPQWEGVVPFADVQSGDREQLDRFCRVVEGMLPMLVRLRGMKGSGGDWADAIAKLMQRFLDVPDDRPEEERVRDALLESLEKLREWDGLLLGDGSPTRPAGSRSRAPSARDGAEPRPTRHALPLALIREFLVSHLREIPGRRNEFLSSGVTIAALQPQRAIPFEVIFLAGMGEKHFPGGAAPSSFDLRQTQRQPGDILPVELQQFAFLEAILAARQKLVVTYNCRDLQMDEDLQPAIPVTQLRRFVGKHVLGGADFEIARAPLTAHDPALLDGERLPPWQDVLVQDRDVDRLLSLDLARQAGQFETSPLEAAAIDAKRRPYAPLFDAPAREPAQRPATPTVSLYQLCKFLENPADAAMRFHLRAKDEWAPDVGDDHEPLVSEKYTGLNLIEQTLETIVRRAETESVDAVMNDWPAVFAGKYQEWSLRGKLPEEAFAEVDAGVLRSEIDTALADAGLRTFLETRAGKTWDGPWLVGENVTPVGAKRRSPALAVGSARLTGKWPFVWMDDQCIDLLVFDAGRFDKGILDRDLFEPLLFVVALTALGELGGRTPVLHLVRPKRIDATPLAGSLLDPETARAYLAELAGDFLDRSRADQLPYKILRKDFAAVYRGAADAGLADSLLRDWRANEEDRDWGDYETALVELQDIGFRVPADVYQKARRRFTPLHDLLPDSKEGDA